MKFKVKIVRRKHRLSRSGILWEFFKIYLALLGGPIFVAYLLGTR